MPMPRRSTPAEREHAVDDSGHWMRSAIAQRRHVGNQADEPEQRRDGGVGRDGENVPYERAAELRPHAHRAGIWKQPISKPRPPDVDSRENSGASHSEQSHGFGETVNRITPRLPQQQQNRRDQRAGVANADPPYKVDDGKAP